MPDRMAIAIEIEKLELEMQRITGGRGSPDKFPAPFLETALKLAKLYLELKDSAKAAEYYADLIDNSIELSVVGVYQRSFIKADMYRKLGLFAEAEKIYAAIIKDTYSIGTASNIGNALRDLISTQQGGYTTFGYKEFYKSALYGLGNTYREHAAANKNKANAEHENAQALECYLNCIKTKSHIAVYNFDLYSAKVHEWEKGPYERYGLFKKYYKSILAAAEIYETLGLTSKAIETYKFLISEQKTAGGDSFNNQARKAALHLIALDPDKKHPNLEYYDIATARRYLESDLNDADFEQLQEELQTISDYIEILESTEYRKSKTIAELKEIDTSIEAKYLAAQDLITNVDLRSLWDADLLNAGKIEKFKAYVLLKKVHVFMSTGKMTATKALISELEQQLPEIHLLPKIEILLRLTTEYDHIFGRAKFWLAQADQLQNELLNSNNTAIFLKLIKLVELHANNNNFDRVKEIFELCMKELPKFADNKKLEIYHALQNIFKNNTKIPEQEILKYNIKLYKYAVDNLESYLTIPNETRELEYFHANLELAKYLKRAEINFPGLITEVEQQLNTELYDSIYWNRQAMNIFHKVAYTADVPTDMTEYYALCEQKFSQASDAYKEKLETVLECGLIGSGSIIISPVSIPIKKNGKLITKTYNEDAYFHKLLLNAAYQTFTVEPDKDFYIESVKLNNARVHLVDPSTNQSISADIIIGHSSTIEANIDELTDRDDSKVKDLIVKTLIPNKLLADLIDYILRSEVINVAEFPGFINDKTGKRFIEPWLTKTGDTVEKNDPQAYCPNTKALEIMQQFPNIKEWLEIAKEKSAKQQDQAALSYLLMAIDQAKEQGDKELNTIATQSLIDYIAKSTNPIFGYLKIDREKPTILIVDAILSKILDARQYADLKSIIDCPISFACAINPLTTAMGNTYEGKAIIQSLKINDRDPSTNQALSDATLIPNKAIASIVPWIITQAAKNQPISLADLPALKNAQGDFYKNPWLTANGNTVEEKDPKAKYPNTMLKQLIEHVNQKPHHKTKLKS